MNSPYLLGPVHLAVVVAWRLGRSVLAFQRPRALLSFVQLRLLVELQIFYWPICDTLLEIDMYIYLWAYDTYSRTLMV